MQFVLSFKQISVIQLFDPIVRIELDVGFFWED